MNKRDRTGQSSVMIAERDVNYFWRICSGLNYTSFLLDYGSLSESPCYTFVVFIELCMLTTLQTSMTFRPVSRVSTGPLEQVRIPGETLIARRRKSADR